MKHLKIFNTQTDYNNVKTTLPLPNMCLLNDTYEIASEGDEDIVPIEYLQSTGAQWINTGIIGDLNTEIEIKFNATETSGYACGNNDTLSRAISIYIESTGNQRFGDKRYACNLPINTLHTIVSNKNGITINGTTYTRTTTTEFTTAAQLYIFKGQTSAATGGKLKVYYFKVRNNGKLIADFIPVRKGTDGCMFDNVSKKLFSNAGTGNFTLGPDIVPVEYLIGASGTYINTGVAGNNNNLKIDIKYSIAAHEQYGAVLGNYVDENSNAWRIILQSSSNNNGYINVNTKAGSSGALTNGGIKNTPIRVVMSKTSITVNSTFNATSITPPGTNGTANATNIALFAKSTTVSPSGTMQTKIMYCKMWDSDVLIRDLIPVRIGTVGYMYDKVSRKLFANAGTGSFVIGPDDIHTKLTRSK